MENYKKKSYGKLGGIILQINFDSINQNLIVYFKGELDHHTAEEIRKEIDKIYFEKRYKNIILNLNNLNFMDSSGIGLLMGRFKLVSQNNGKLCITNVSPRVEKILKMSGILKIVDIYSDVKSASDNI